VVPDLLPNLVAAVVYAVLGIVVFVGAFIVVDRLTPYSLWAEIIERQNAALATLVGFISLALGIIIAAAIV
jgi:uncharacterized membrane protein YjfL (UPF0719 family)